MNKYTVLIFILMLSCGKEQGATKDEHEEETHEEGHNTVELTAAQIKTVGIEYGKVEERQLTATLRINGALTVPNSNKATITSFYGGVVESIRVELGDWVKMGEVIATVANPQFIQLQEEFLSASSKIIFAEQEMLRQKELSQGNAGALKNYQSADAELNALKTRKASLQQQLGLMGINSATLENGNMQSFISVRSPINGTVSNLYAKLGTYIDVSSPLAEVVDNSKIHLDLNVFEKDLPMIRLGQNIHFRLTNNASQEYEAKVFSIGASFENVSKSIPVHADVRGNKKGLIDGMNITAIVQLNDITSPSVPDDAVVSAEGRDFIFIVSNIKEERENKGGNVSMKTKITVFEKVEVARGVSNMGYTAVTLVKDIPADALVVVKGSFFINAKMTNTEGGH